MGVNHSSGVRWKLQPLVPHSWAELEQLYLRFQQEAHRRRADPAFQYFLPFAVFQAVVAPLCADKDKLQMLAMFEALDVRRVGRLAAVDFFSGLALLVDAKKPQKLEFVLSLLDNGGLKTLNKCELTMVVSAAARGIKMFAPGADALQESTMRPLIRRLFGDEDEVLRQTVVNKALADPEILFFMSDLEAGVATSSDELLIQQGKLMRHVAYLDYQAARLTTSAPEENGRSITATKPSSSPVKWIEGQRAPIPSVENFARKLQSIVCPTPAKAADQGHQSIRTLSAVEVKKHVDARTLQRLVHVVSDGGMPLSRTEAEELIRDMARDQFGLVRCADILRVMKAWVQHRRQEKPEALWDIVGTYVVGAVKRIEARMNAALESFVERASRTLGPSARRRTTVAKDRLLESLQNIALKPDTDDGELQWNVSVRVGGSDSQEQATPSNSAAKRAGVPLGNNIRFRLGIHPPSSTDDDDPEDADTDTMRLTANFLLNSDITDEEGIDLASSVERSLQQDQVWSSFASLWSACSVTIHSAVRNDGGVQPGLGKYLRVCVTFCEDFILSVEECTGTSFAAGIRSFYILGELDQSVADIVQASQEIARLLHSLGKRQNRERAMRLIFEAFDADHSDEWSLPEFNTFQQALGKEALLEATLTELFGGCSTISFEKFVSTYENYPAARLFEMMRQLGIGSLGDLVKGSVTLSSALNEPCVKALEVLLSPLRWADAGWKKLIFLSRTTKDLNLELQFPKLADIKNVFGHSTKLDFVGDPLFVASWIERLEEFMQPTHAEHFKDRPCRSIFCSLEREANKTEQQWEFDDQSRKLPRGTSARRAGAMLPFLEMARLIKAHILGLEIVEVRSTSIRIVCELDNLWMSRPKDCNHDVDALGPRPLQS